MKVCEAGKSGADTGQGGQHVLHQQRRQVGAWRAGEAMPAQFFQLGGGADRVWQAGDEDMRVDLRVGFVGGAGVEASEYLQVRLVQF